MAMEYSCGVLYYLFTPCQSRPKIYRGLSCSGPVLGSVIVQELEWLVLTWIFSRILIALLEVANQPQLWCLTKYLILEHVFSEVWQVQNLQCRSVGWKPREEPVLQFKTEGYLLEEFLLAQREVSLCSLKAFY